MEHTVAIKHVFYVFHLSIWHWRLKNHFLNLQR